MSHLLFLLFVQLSLFSNADAFQSKLFSKEASTFQTSPIVRGTSSALSPNQGFSLCGIHDCEQIVELDWIGRSALSMVQGESADDGGMDIVESRKKRIAREYRVVSVAVLPVAALMASFFKAPAQMLYASTGPLLASAVAHILRGASMQDRLGSDTYKRLNLFLAKYLFCVALAFLPLHANITSLWVGLSFLLAMKPSVKGWFYGVRGVKKGGSASLTGDIVEGTKRSIKGMTSVKNIKAFGYLMATYFVGSLCSLKLVGIVSMAQGGAAPIAISGRLIRFAKLSLLASLVFSLKDAADRGRLDGTTFVQLNFLSSFAFGTMAANDVQVGGLTIMAASAAFISFFSGMNGAASMIKKREKS